jgi:hypothetical protein
MEAGLEKQFSELGLDLRHGWLLDIG